MQKGSLVSWISTSQALSVYGFMLVVQRAMESMALTERVLHTVHMISVSKYLI